MSVSKMTIHLEGVYQKIKQVETEGSKVTVESMLKDTEKYIPKNTGELRRSGSVVNGGIEYDAPYAMKMYYTPLTHYTTPGTGSHWFERSKGENLNKWLKDFEGGVRW